MKKVNEQARCPDIVRDESATGKRYLLDSIPAGLWASVREKCKREGVSIRAQILKLLKEWIEKS